MGLARICLRALAVFVLACALSVTRAAANPMEDTSLGGAVFTGPVSAHPSSFFVNPAALALGRTGYHLHFGSSARLRRLVWEQEDGERTVDHSASPGGIFAWYSSFLNGRARFGVSIYTPITERFPRAHEAFQYHSRGGHIVQSNVTLGGALKINSSFILGLGFSIGYSSVRLKFARDSVLDGGSSAESGTESDCGGQRCGLENPQARELYDVRVGGDLSFGEIFAFKNLSGSIGLAYRLPDRSWLGMSYVVLPGAFGIQSSGNATVTRAPRDGGGQEQSVAEVGYSMAQMLFLGYRRDLFARMQLVGDIRWQDWSRHSQFDLRLFGGNLSEETPEWISRYRGFQDTFRFSLGLESNPQQDRRFGLRLRYNTNSVSNRAISPVQVGRKSVTLATGTELRLARHWVVQLGYELGWYPAISVGNSAFDPQGQIDCVDSWFEFSQCETARQGRGIPSAAGRYSQLEHGFVLSLRYDSL